MFLNDLHVWKTHEERVNTESFLTSSGEDLLQILWVSKVYNAEIEFLEKDLLKLFFPFFFFQLFSQWASVKPYLKRWLVFQM